MAGRVDQKLTSRDDLFFRFKIDHGLTADVHRSTDARFDANSNQPAWDYQVNWRHVFSANMTNAFTATVEPLCCAIRARRGGGNGGIPLWRCDDTGVAWA